MVNLIYISRVGICTTTLRRQFKDIWVLTMDCHIRNRFIHPFDLKVNEKAMVRFSFFLLQTSGYAPGIKCFSWESGGSLPLHSYKPSQDLSDAILKRRTISVERLAIFLGTDKQTHTHTQRQTARQKSCYFYIKI